MRDEGAQGFFCYSGHAIVLATADPFDMASDDDCREQIVTKLYSTNSHIRTYIFGSSLVKFLLGFRNLANCGIGEVK